jgi:hypothetical protein
MGEQDYKKKMKASIKQDPKLAELKDGVPDFSKLELPDINFDEIIKYKKNPAKEVDSDFTDEDEVPKIT